MSKLLLNFAFATTLYTEKRNYLETFSPFVLSVLGDDKVRTAKEICDILKRDSNLTIPTNTSRTILKVLAREKYVKEEGNDPKYRVTEKGKKHLSDFTETEGKIKRKHNEFFKAFEVYLKNHELMFDYDKIEPKVMEFINENIHFLTLYNADGTFNPDFTDGISDPVDLQLLNFIAEIEHQSQTLYETFEELLKGAVLWQHIANKEELPEKESAFDSLTVYLDANIVLSILGLHHPTINEAASQLLAMMKDEKKISLCVLSITLEEIGRLLKAYKNQKDNFNANIGVDSIYYFLKQKGYDEIRTLDLINNLDKKIKDKGLSIAKHEQFEVDSLNKGDKELYQDLYTFNKEINENRKEDNQKEERTLHLSTLHDAAIINRVKSERGAWVKSLERSKSIFLTESYRLEEFCKKRYKNNDHFPEVILDLTMTNILWLKNPKKDFSLKLHKLIAVHSKKMLVDKGIWRKFTSTLKEFHRKGELTAQQYALLFSSNQLTVDYLHKVRADQITLGSLTELSQKIERDILKDKSTKVVKDSIIKVKTQELSALKEEIEKKQKEIETKDAELKDKALDNVSLSEDLRVAEGKLEQQSDELSKLTTSFKRLDEERKCKEFVDQKMEDEYSPLGRRALFMLLAALVALVLIYISQVADGDDQNWLKLTSSTFKLCKLVAILLAAGLTMWMNKAYKKDLWLYVFNRKKLKKEMKERFSNEFKSPNTEHA